MKRTKARVEVPITVFERVLAMAEEMSGENAYAEVVEIDGVPTTLGVDPHVEADLEKMRVWIKAEKKRRLKRGRKKIWY